jgi:nitrogen regulatory protein PII
MKKIEAIIRLEMLDDVKNEEADKKVQSSCGVVTNT